MPFAHSINWKRHRNFSWNSFWKNQNWYHKLSHLNNFGCCSRLCSFHCKNDNFDIWIYLLFLMFSSYSNDITICWSIRKELTNSKYLYHHLFNWKILLVTSFLSHCKFPKIPISMLINHVSLSRQQWSFTIKLKMNHYFMVGGLLTVNVLDAIKVEFAYFTTWFVAKKRKKKHKNISKGNRNEEGNL